MEKDSRSLNQIQLIILFFIILFLSESQPAKAQFANGADVSWLTEMEDSGYVFKDNSGVKKNCLEILKEKGINALRFRVWVNPAEGYNGIKDIVRKSFIADSMGFKIMLDFHFSDTWADPGHQTKPAAWADDSFPQLQQDVYNHVYSVLDTLKTLGVVPEWVQLGNEVGHGMLWPDGAAPSNMDNFAQLIKSGYNAVKSVDSTIQVVIHLEDGHKDELFRTIFDGLKSHGAEWDIIGMSVYPYWAKLSWADDDSLALITMKDMIARYNTRVMVCEAGYPYDKPVEANHYLLDLIAKTKSAGGLGVFYWEPECYDWHGYNLGAWDPVTKEPTAALDAFLGINPTLVSRGKNIVTQFELKIFPNPFNPSTTIQYSLPHTGKVVIEIYDVLGSPVQTLINDIENPGVHTVRWSGQSEKVGRAASGIYLVSLKYGEDLQVRKIIFLK